MKKPQITQISTYIPQPLKYGHENFERAGGKGFPFIFEVITEAVPEGRDPNRAKATLRFADLMFIIVEFMRMLFQYFLLRLIMVYKDCGITLSFDIQINCYYDSCVKTAIGKRSLRERK
jgi:hypothetical protein